MEEAKSEHMYVLTNRGLLSEDSFKEDENKTACFSHALRPAASNFLIFEQLLDVSALATVSDERCLDFVGSVLL